MDLSQFDAAQLDDLVITIAKELHKRQHYVKGLDRLSIEELKHLCFCILTDHIGAKIVFDIIKPAFIDALDKTLHPKDWIKWIKCLEAQVERMKPKPRFEERDDEIVRLRDEVLPGGKQRSFGQIAQLLNKKWPNLSPAATGRAYTRAKSAKSAKSRQK